MSDTTKTVTLAIAGNPNSGKTTLFNGLTGSRQRIGNWPGVTVEKKEGPVRLDALSELLVAPYIPAPGHTDIAHEGDVATAGGTAHLVDLPGIYSISATSEDEIIARDYLLSGDADMVLNIIDATNFERNLYLTIQLIEMRIPVIVVLNMIDLAEKDGIEIDTEHLSKHLGVPVISVSAIRKEGIQRVKRVISEAVQDRRVSEVSIPYPEPIERQIEAWAARLSSVARRIGTTERWIGIKLLEGDPWILAQVAQSGDLSRQEVSDAIASLESELHEEVDVLLADARYGFIHGLGRHVTRKRIDRERATSILDRFVMSRALGIPIFLGVMYLVFWLTIAVGGAFIDFFDILFGTVFVDGFGVLLSSLGSPEWLIGILAGGIGAGVQTVATFLPIIFTMFLMLALLEDSGYMARAAFVMDRFMRLIGLPGKSFVPMMVGFGCTVPAIMGTRTLETKKDRFMTIFMSPFMSCGARLPVYALFSAAFFPRAAGLVTFSLYIGGIVLAILTGLFLKMTIFKGTVSHFVMELPPYHIPRPGHILRSAWHRLRVFAVRAGVTIVIAVSILAFFNSLGTDGSFGNEDTEQSVLASVGRTITPVFTPMGIEEENWPATVGLFTGLFAKEAIVGTLNSLYSQNEAPELEGEGFDLAGGVTEAFSTIPENLAGVGGGLVDPLGLGLIGTDEETLLEELETDGAVFRRMRDQFTPLGAYAYLLFVLIYFPCVAALGAAVREMGRGYGWLLAGYLTVLAWAVATLFYQLSSGPQFGAVVGALSVIAGLGLVFVILGRTTRQFGDHSAGGVPSGSSD
jgi:ferrous iron transport protein B